MMHIMAGSSLAQDQTAPGSSRYAANHPLNIEEFHMSQTFSPPTHTFEVTGMTCGHCEKAVTRAVKQLDANAEVAIDRSTGRVDVSSQQPREQLIKAIVEEGYAVAA
jgi:copper chaperone